MAEINIEIDPKSFEKFATDILNKFKAQEIEIRAYRAMFNGLAQQHNFTGLDVILETMRNSSAVQNPVNLKYAAALEDIQKFVRGSIPDEVFLRLMKLDPLAELEN